MASHFEISKLVDEEYLVFGWANVSVSRTGDGRPFQDLQSDIIPPVELEKGAYSHVLEFREADEMHKGGAVGQLVESMVFTPDKLVKFATDPVTNTVDTGSLAVLQKLFPPRWWVGYKLDPAAYAKVKSGEYRMFSVAGEAEAVQVEN